MQIVEFKVDTTLPILNGNFEALKHSLSEHLVKYEIEVNETNFTDAEKMEKEINKLIRQIDGKRKEIVSDVKNPIDFFNAKCKELTELCEQSLTKIKEQTGAFKQRRQEKWVELLQKELLSQYAKLNIKDEFKTVSILDLAIKSNFTDAGNLSKSARDTISERAQCVLSLQNLVHVRLVELENASLKAGLKSPLEARHVEVFLKTDDSTYKAQLNTLFANEIKRQQEIEEKVMADHKREQERREIQSRAEEQKKAEIYVQAGNIVNELMPEMQDDLWQATKGVMSNTFRITVICEVRTQADKDYTKLKFLEVLAKAGVKNSIQNVTIINV